MKLVLQTLLEELTRLKNAGVTTLPVSEDSLASLRKAVEAHTPGLQAVGVEQASPGHSHQPRPSSPPPPASVPAPTSEAPRPAPRDQGTGLDAYLSRKEPEKAAPPAAHASATRKLPPPPELQVPNVDKAARLTWLASQLRNDAVCRAHAGQDAAPLLDLAHLEVSVLFLSDSPTEEEESSREPFANPAGQLFLKIMQAMGLPRDSVHLGYALPWRPVGPIDPSTGKPAHREPSAEEIHYAQPFLKALIATIQPRIIVGLGSTAGKAMFGTTAFKALNEIRGQWKDFEGLPTIITYHPNYLKLKEMESKVAEKKAKRAAWEDMLKVMERLDLPISEKQRAYFL